MSGGLDSVEGSITKHERRVAQVRSPSTLAPISYLLFPIFFPLSPLLKLRTFEL